MVWLIYSRIDFDGYLHLAWFQMSKGFAFTFIKIPGKGGSGSGISWSPSYSLLSIKPNISSLKPILTGLGHFLYHFLKSVVLPWTRLWIWSLYEKCNIVLHMHLKIIERSKNQTSDYHHTAICKWYLSNTNFIKMEREKFLLLEAFGVTSTLG